MVEAAAVHLALEGVMSCVLDRLEAERFSDGDVVEITQVTVDSAAERGGLKPGDLIVEIDAQRLAGLADLQAALETDSVGTPIALTILRSGQERKLVVTPTELAP